MLSLLLAVISTAMVSTVMRLSTGRVKSDLGMLAMNYLMCTALSAAFSGVGGAGLSGTTAALGAVNGVTYLVSFLLLQSNVKRNGVVLPSAFMKLGLLVTMAVSVLWFGEVPEPRQVAGFLVALAAIFVINFRGGERVRSGGALVALLLCGGMADAMSKVFEELGPGGQEDAFLLFTFGTALVLCVLWLVRSKQKPGLWEAVFGMLIGIPNFFSSRFLLGALESLAAVIVYPVYSVGGIALVTVIGLLAFRERLEKRQWLGLGLIALSLVLLNS